MDGVWLASYLALWAIVLLQAFLLLGLAREIGEFHLRARSSSGSNEADALATDAGLAIGTVAPGFKAIEIPSGEEVDFQPVGAPDTLLIFVSPSSCRPCHKLLSALAARRKEWQTKVGLTIVCEGDVEEARALLKQTRTAFSLLTDPLSRVRDAYGQPPVPFAFLMDAEGVIKSKGVVITREDIDRLIDGKSGAADGLNVVVQGLAAAEHARSLPETEEVPRGQVG